tara:strand:+ start:20 stop:379 length:360 start_codon:yes stop_codon:yes gene_type:complete
MSSIPKIDKTKYNKDNKFAWVDSQWEKFMKEQKEHKAIIKQLQQDLGTCTKNYSRLYDKYSELETECKNLKQYFNIEDARGDEWKIEQFNRNRSIEQQVSTIEEMEAKVKKLFKENNNG